MNTRAMRSFLSHADKACRAEFQVCEHEPLARAEMRDGGIGKRTQVNGVAAQTERGFITLAGCQSAIEPGGECQCGGVANCSLHACDTAGVPREGVRLVAGIA